MKTIKFNIQTIFITLLIITLCCISCKEKNNSNDELHFTGTLEGYGDGIVEIQFYGPKEVTKDSIFVTNGKFEYTKKLKSPRQAFILIYNNENLNVERNRYVISYFMENSQINLKLNINDLDNYTLTGSKTDDENRSIREDVKSFAQKYSNARKAYSKSERESKDSLKQKFDQTTDEYLSALKKNNLFSTSHAGPYILWLTSRYVSSDKLATLFPLFDSKLDNNLYLEYMINKREGENRVKPGKPAPSFLLKDLSGKEYTLEDFSGNYLLLDFEASWCKPCKIEIPFLIESYEKYSSKGLNIISVNLDKTRELWVKDKTTENLPWKMLSDLTAFDGELTKNYGITSIPRIFLIDPKGKIVANSLRGKKILAKLEEVFDN